MNWFLVGDGVDRYGDVIGEDLGGKVHMPGGLFSFPRAHNLALLAKDRFERGNVDDLAEVIPNYVRRSDAEIGFKGSGVKCDK